MASLQVDNVQVQNMVETIEAVELEVASLQVCKIINSTMASSKDMF